jgi:hypothetical protein
LDVFGERGKMVSLRPSRLEGTSPAPKNRYTMLYPAPNLAVAWRTCRRHQKRPGSGRHLIHRHLYL